MNVMSAPKAVSTPQAQASFPNPFKKQPHSTNFGDSFQPGGGPVKKGLYGLAYFGAPAVAGFLGSNVGTMATMVAGGATGVYAARHMPGMQKAQMGLAGLFVASSAANIGGFIANIGSFARYPNPGAILNLGISGLICYTSGHYLMQMSE